jgi:hypothetical protein
MFAAEFIGEYFYLRPAMMTFTEKRFQVLKGFKSSAMAAWRIHRVRLLRVFDLACVKQRTEWKRADPAVTPSKSAPVGSRRIFSMVSVHPLMERQ